MRKASILFSIMLLLLLTSCKNDSFITSETTFHEVWTATQEHYWERELIYNFVNGEHDQWYSLYKLDYWFIMKELETPFSRYNATTYQCTWTLDLKDDTSSPTRVGQVNLFLIIKNNIVYHIETKERDFSDIFNLFFDHIYEIDFDHDEQNELIYYIDIGSDMPICIFYVFEPAEDEPIYITKYAFAHPIKIENDELIILAGDDKKISGIFKYRLIDGIKDFYIDAGEYTDMMWRK